MGTATAERKKKETTPAGTGVVTGLVGNGDHHALIEAGRIIPSPTNPRKHFDKASQKDLAESIKTYGLIQPVIVMPTADDEKGARWEIVAGERRYRACLEAGLEKVPCIVRAVDAKLIREVQLIENLARKDLNPIEEAEAFLHLTTEGGHTQRDLAKRINCSQAHIGNRIRLLDLPEPWRGRLISQEIPPTHARALLPWANRPTVLKEIEDRIIENGKMVDVSMEDLEAQIRSAVVATTRSMRKAQWPEQSHACHFKPRPEDEEALDIQEIGGERRAFNIELYDQLQKEAMKRSKQRRKKEQEKYRGGSKQDPAELARMELQGKLADYVAELRKQGMIEWTSKATDSQCLRLLMARVYSEDLWMRVEELEELVPQVGGRMIQHKIKTHWGSRKVSDWVGTILTIPEERWPEFIRSALTLSLQAGQAEYEEAQRELRSAVESLEIDITASWKISREFLEIYPQEQLIELAVKEFKLKESRAALEAMTLEELIEHVLTGAAKAKLPKSLLKL